VIPREGVESGRRYYIAEAERPVGYVIPREGVESFLGGNETSLQVTLTGPVIPREGVESYNG